LSAAVGEYQTTTGVGNGNIASLIHSDSHVVVVCDQGYAAYGVFVAGNLQPITRIGTSIGCYIFI
jgi:hypothetical protein